MHNFKSILTLTKFVSYATDLWLSVPDESHVGLVLVVNLLPSKLRFVCVLASQEFPWEGKEQYGSVVLNIGQIPSLGDGNN